MNVDKYTGTHTEVELVAGIPGRSMTEPDLVADILALPHADGSVDRILASHVLEHIELLGGSAARALREWQRVLKPGGKCLVVCPDVVRSAEMAYLTRAWHYFWNAHASAGSERGNPYHKPAPPNQPDGIAHQWNCSQEALILLSLLSANECAVEPIRPSDASQAGWPCTPADYYQCAVLLTKLPAQPT